MQEIENYQHAQPNGRDGLKDTHQAAAYLQCSASFLEKRRCFGGGPVYVRIGRAIRYRISDLDAWVAKQAHSNTASQVSGDVN